MREPHVAWFLGVYFSSPMAGPCLPASFELYFRPNKGVTYHLGYQCQYDFVHLDELSKSRTEVKNYVAQTQRLEKRCSRLQSELQEAKDATKQSRGLLGGVFASGLPS